MPISAATASLIGAGISAASTGASTVAGGKMNKKTRKWATKENQLNRDFSVQQAEAARQWAEDFYNDYSSPEAMRAQYEAAGMNPYLAMENAGGSVGSSPTASSGPSASPSNSWNPVPLNFSSVSDAINSYFGNLRSATETDMEQQFGSDLRKSQIFQNLGGNWSPLEDVFRDYQRSRSKDYAMLQDTSLRQKVQAERIALENSLAQGALLGLEADAKKILNRYIEPQQQAELMSASARWFDMMQGGILKAQQVKQSIAETVKTYAEAHGQKIDNKIAESTADSLIQAMKAENEYNRRNFFIGAKQLPYDYGLHQQERYYRYQEMRYDKDVRFGSVNKFMDQYIAPITNQLGNLVGTIFSGMLGTGSLKALSSTSKLSKKIPKYSWEK